MTTDEITGDQTKPNRTIKTFFRILETLINGERNNENLDRTLPQLLRLYDLSSSDGWKKNIRSINKSLDWGYTLTDASITIREVVLGERTHGKLFDDARIERLGSDTSVGPFEMRVNGLLSPPPIKSLTYQVILDIKGGLGCKYHVTLDERTIKNRVIPPKEVSVGLLGRINQPMREIEAEKLWYSISVPKDPKQRTVLASGMDVKDTEGDEEGVGHQVLDVKIEPGYTELAEIDADTLEAWKRDLRQQLEELRKRVSLNELSADERETIEELEAYLSSGGVSRAVSIETSWLCSGGWVVLKLLGGIEKKITGLVDSLFTDNIAPEFAEYLTRPKEKPIVFTPPKHIPIPKI